MKKLNLIVSAFALLLVVTSCDVLEEEIVSGITVDAHYTNPAGFQDAVRAAYERLRYRPGENSFTTTEYGTDAMTNAGHGGNHDLDSYEQGIENTFNGAWTGIWNGHYQAINTTNAVIGRAPEADVPAEEKAIRVGEARFLRAYYYFDLVRTFGRVHLSLEETQGVETTANIVESSATYAAIVEDLEAAIAALPVTQAEYGRATKPAAEILLAHVLLTRAGNGDLQRVVQLTDGVINNYSFELLDQYEDLWSNGDLNPQGTELAMGTDPSVRRNDEVIFSVQYSTNTLNNGGGNSSRFYFRPWYENINGAINRVHFPGYGRPWIRFRPTQWGLDAFLYKNEDLTHDERFDRMFQREWFTTPGGQPSNTMGIFFADEALTPATLADLQAQYPSARVYTWRSENLVAKGGPFQPHEVRHFSQELNMFPYNKKHDDWTVEGVNDGDGRNDYYLYRLADAYLFNAEARVRMGDNAGAVSYINAIRERAAFPGQEAEMRVNAGDVDIDLVLDEMHREFYAEGRRWYDLVRTGKLIERNVNLAQNDGGNGGYGAVAGATAPNPQPHHMVRPIPQSAIDETIDTVIEQNPGY